ncbi:MAG: hypothetical protein JO257_22730 [Deltaproteobacteria bacterium]|nr:hypothetical protein [Deltaproteobacteria bacterium]
MKGGYARMRDGNEPGIVDALRSVGATVCRLNESGIPDLLVGFRGGMYLLEVKRPLGARGGLPEHREHEGGRGDMTEAQVRWWEAWRGPAPAIVRTPAEALAAIGADVKEATR